MAKRYLLSLYFHGQSERLIFEVRKSDSDRLASLLDQRQPDDLASFFWFETVDGKSVAFNLERLQAVRYLWNPTDLPPDSTRYEGMINISLHGRADVIEAYTDDPDQLFDFLTDLEQGKSNVCFPRFDDEDGETIQFSAAEIVWVIAPSHLVSEGEQMVATQDGLLMDDKPDSPIDPR